MPDFQGFASAGGHAAYTWCAYGFVIVAMAGGVLAVRRGLRRALQRAAHRIERAVGGDSPSER